MEIEDSDRSEICLKMSVDLCNPISEYSVKSFDFGPVYGLNGRNWQSLWAKCRSNRRAKPKLTTIKRIYQINGYRPRAFPN